MTSVYPFLTVMGAHTLRVSTFNTPGIESKPVLVIAAEDEIGFAVTTMHITGLPAETIKRLVEAAEVKELEAV